MTKQNSEQELTSNVPYRESFQRGAASRDREIDELRAHIERLREMIIEAMEWNWLDDDAPERFELDEITPAQSLSAYHDSIVEKCASVADEYGHTDNVIARDIRELKEQK
jgi:D-mannonate dehydratase